MTIAQPMVKRNFATLLQVAFNPQGPTTKR